MYDILHKWGSDLVAGNSGDLAVSTGSNAVNQRIYRRLLTNPSEYIWNLDYGGGLTQFIGSPVTTADIEAIVRVQLELEPAVPTTPTPQVIVRIADPANGYIVASITYADPSSMVPIQLNVSAS